MIWFILLIIALIVLGATIVAHAKSKDPYDAWLNVSIGAGVVAVILFLLMAIGTAVFYGRSVTTDGQITKLENTKYQRDQLVDLIHDELSAEQYNALLAFTNNDQMKIFFQTTGESDVLIARASAIVDLNRTLFEKYNQIVGNQISLCAAKNNPFTPLIPGIINCRVDIIQELNGQIDVYSGR